MPGDITTARLLSYEKNLRRCPLLYEAAQLTREEPDDTANRFIRSVSGEDPERVSSVLYADCDYVISPALHGYMLWVLRQAEEAGIERLYFLARDGYLMYHAAEQICGEMDLPVECRYLYCSRYSVRIPMFCLEQEEALEYICRGGIDVTLTKVLNRAGLSDDEREQVCGELKSTPFGEKLAGGQTESLDGIVIPHAMLPQLREALESSQLFLDFMRRHSREAMPALEGYFRQEGLMDEIPMAVVDCGWTGSMQKVMNRLLSGFGKREHLLSGYYWGLYELPADVDARMYHCYYFTPYTHLREKILFSNNLFEEIYSAPHGLTLRYEEKDGVYRPVTQETEELHGLFMDQIEGRVSIYTGNLLAVLSRMKGKAVKEMLDCSNDRETIRTQFGLFMGHPTPAEAELFGRLSFSDDVLEYGGQLAAEMTDRELKGNHAGRKVLTMLGAADTPIKESAWYEASAVLNGIHINRHIRRYKRYKYLLYRNKARIYRRQR